MFLTYIIKKSQLSCFKSIKTEFGDEVLKWRIVSDSFPHINSKKNTQHKEESEGQSIFSTVVAVSMGNKYYVPVWPGTSSEHYEAIGYAVQEHCSIFHGISVLLFASQVLQSSSNFSFSDSCYWPRW